MRKADLHREFLAAQGNRAPLTSAGEYARVLEEMLLRYLGDVPLSRRVPAAGEVWEGNREAIAGRVIRIDGVGDKWVDYTVLEETAGRSSKPAGRITASSLRTAYKPSGKAPGGHGGDLSEAP